MKANEQTEFGLRLQEAREDANYTRDEVGVILGWKFSDNLWKWERMGRQVNDLALVELCVLYDITPNYLYGFEYRYDGDELIDDEYE